MKTTTVSALTALLFAGAQAVPMAGHNHKAPAHGHMHHRNKRDIVWETTWEVETVVVFKTVYANGDEATELASTSTVAATSTSVAASSSVAPAPVSPKETGNAPPAYTTPSTTTQAPAPTTLSTTSSYVAPPAPTTTTTTEAPAPTSYVEPTPAPTTTQAPAPAPEPTTYAPAPSPTQSSGSSSGGAEYTGDATYWDPAMGACGWTNSDGEDVVAISQLLFDPKTPGGNPNNNPLCGKFVNIKSTDGSTISAKVVDRCTGCKEGDLDMTRTLFKKVTVNGDGRMSGMQWSWA